MRVRRNKLKLLVNFARRVPGVTVPPLHWWEEDAHHKSEITKADEAAAQEAGAAEAEGNDGGKSGGEKHDAGPAAGGGSSAFFGSTATGGGASSRRGFAAPVVKKPPTLAHVVSETAEARAVREIGFLFQSYQVSCWYWEVVVRAASVIPVIIGKPAALCACPRHTACLRGASRSRLMTPAHLAHPAGRRRR